MPKASAVCLAAFAVGLFALTAQPAWATSPTQIAGLVTSKITKAPMSGVKVCEYPIEAGAGSACTTTNGSGEYILGVGAAGEFVVYFDTAAKGYIPHTYYNEVFVGSQAPGVTVHEGETKAGVNEAIEEGGRISGVVTDAVTKAKLEGIQVCAQLPELVQLAGGLETHRTCEQTDSAGAYTIEGLPPGEGIPAGGYDVEFTSGSSDYIRQLYEGAAEVSEAKLIPVVAEHSFPGVNAALYAGGQISGKVTSAATGAPVEGAVACASQQGHGEICAKTSASGEYTISSLPSGEYRVVFAGPTGGPVEYISQYYEEKEWPDVEPVEVSAPQAVVGADATLKARGQITGKVTSKLTHAPVAGVQVCAQASTFNGQGEPCETTNAQGEYTIRHLNAGGYELSFGAYRIDEEGVNYLSQPYGHATNEQGDAVSVAMAATATVDDELSVGGRISGLVTNAKTGRPAGGWPCAEDLSEPDPHLAKTCATSMSEGEYTISQLPPGEYRMVFADGRTPAEEFYEQFWDGVSSESEATPIKIEEGSTISGIDAALQERKAFNGEGIEGRVVDAVTKKQIKGIEVCAYAIGDEEAEGLFGECTETNASGEYALLGLSAEEYEVEFSTPYGSEANYVTQYYDEASSYRTATPVTIEADTIRTEIGASMHHGGRVAGRVTAAAGGEPLAGILTCAIGVATESIGCDETNRNGEYLITGLAAGAYAVIFTTPPESSLDYVTQFYDERLTAEESDPVSVSVEQTTAGIDARLNAAGAISGTVTDADTGMPVEGILVCALDMSGEAQACTDSAASGEYTLLRLPASEYKVGFNGGGRYLTQFYDDAFSLAKATQVSIGESQHVSDIDAAMGHTAAEAPSSGETLPAAPVPPPLDSSPPPPVAIAPQLGVADARSSSPELSLSTNVLLARDEASVHATCAISACRGTLELVERVLTRRGRTSSATTIVLARGSFKISAGAHGTVKLHLTSAGIKRLAHASRHEVNAKLSYELQGGRHGVKAVTVR